jgi:hypothetical protein
MAGINDLTFNDSEITPINRNKSQISKKKYLLKGASKNVSPLNRKRDMSFKFRRPTLHLY